MEQALPELKARNHGDRIINSAKGSLDISSFRDDIKLFISRMYNKGLEIAGKIFKLNFVKNEENLAYLNNYVFENMKKHTDDMGQALRSELQRGISDNPALRKQLEAGKLSVANSAKLKQNIKNVFEDKKFSERLKMVMRTEGLGASNLAQMDAARQSGLNLKKYLSVILDGVTSDICKAEHKKYGEKSKAIPFDDDFIVKVSNKTITKQQPHFHPNCRTVVRFLQVPE